MARGDRAGQPASAAAGSLQRRRGARRERRAVRLPRRGGPAVHMRILIVDDEAAARSRLASLIEEIDAEGTEIVGEAPDGMRALELVRRARPDVLLLDITMPEVDGFDVARHLPEPRPLVIFQTAHHEFALQAFDHDALDYVVKPV